MSSKDIIESSIVEYKEEWRDRMESDKEKVTIKNNKKDTLW